MTNEISKLTLETQEAMRVYHSAMSAAREALNAEIEAIDKEIARYENIDGCLTSGEDKAYDALLDRRCTVFCEREGLYY